MNDPAQHRVRFIVAIVVMLTVSFATTFGLLSFIEANDKPTWPQVCGGDHIGPQPPGGWPDHGCVPWG